MANEDVRAKMARHESPFLTSKEAAYYLCLAAQTLEKMRQTGEGPSYRKHGSYVRYHINDLDAWSEERRRLKTSEKGKQG